MKTLEKIEKKIGLTEVLQKLVSNEIKIPILDTFNLVSEYWYPHPPCLIPLFLGYGASYRGIIHHFFCNRKNTFVEFYLENGYMSETSRTEKQLFTMMILDMIITEDKITSDILEFSERIQYREVNDIYYFFNEYGDDSDEFNKLPYFKDKLPFENIEDLDDYNGDYPSSIYIANPLVIEKSSPFEVANLDFLKDIPNVPIWFDENIDKKELFNQYIRENKLKEAWFTLNSKNWLLKDVAEALNILKMKSDDELLHLVADNWIAGWRNSNAKDGDKY